jgi:hypothetical protein
VIGQRTVVCCRGNLLGVAVMAGLVVLVGVIVSSTEIEMRVCSVKLIERLHLTTQLNYPVRSPPR